MFKPTFGALTLYDTAANLVGCIFYSSTNRGSPPKNDAGNSKYFVVGGVIIPENAWHTLRDAILGLKLRFRLRGEIKWRYFSPHNEDSKNPMRNLDHAMRNDIRKKLIEIITRETSVKTLACICSVAAAYEMDSINSQEDLYHGTYKPITERFQYYLQDESRRVETKQFGIIVADHRGNQDDKRLRGHHQKLLHSTGGFTSEYKNLIEGLFLEPSNLSVGIQLADLVAGAVWRKFERGDSAWYDLLLPSIRCNHAKSVDGHGIVKFPRTGWR